MINTKLILVDGITGSGKSSTAHFIKRQLEKNGLKAVWFYEIQKNHPLHIQLDTIENESESEKYLRGMKEFLNIWKNLVAKIKDDDIIYIVESFIFKDSLCMPLIMSDLDYSDSEEFIFNICEIVKDLNPVLIHFYQNNVERHLKLTWNRRPDGMKSADIEMVIHSLYSKNRGLIGENGTIRIWQDFTELSLKIFDKLDIPKIKIENSSQDWNSYKNMIMNFLGLQYFDEYVHSKNYSRFCGEFLGKCLYYKIYIEGNKLYCDSFWLKLRLIPVSENEFEFEGFKTVIKFIENANKEINRIEFKSELGFDSDSFQNADKYYPPGINLNLLEQYCGYYWCETEKLERKIYLKDDKLYYWRNEDSETRLLPITETRFVMITNIENNIDFVLIDNNWQFYFEVKGENPQHLLFVMKNEPLIS
jgi:thymidylate kinase